MRKIKKFTFKLHPKETGLASVGFPCQSADIKLNKKMCGTIYSPNWRTKDGMYSASMLVCDSSTSCGFKWRKLKLSASTLQEAKDWINDRAESLQSLNLYFVED